MRKNIAMRLHEKKMRKINNFRFTVNYLAVDNIKWCLKSDKVNVLNVNKIIRAKNSLVKHFSKHAKRTRETKGVTKQRQTHQVVFAFGYTDCQHKCVI